jgi:hypothetical protein
MSTRTNQPKPEEELVTASAATRLLTDGETAYPPVPPIGIQPGFVPDVGMKAVAVPELPGKVSAGGIPARGAMSYQRPAVYGFDEASCFW